MNTQSIINHLKHHNVVCSNIEERRNCLAIFKAFGMNLYGTLARDYSVYPELSVLVEVNGEIHLDSQGNFRNRKPIKFSEFYKFFEPVQIIVSLDTVHEAIVTEDTVKIKGHKFSIDVIPALYEAYQKIKG